jgi:hypothetical protein
LPPTLPAASTLNTSRLATPSNEYAKDSCDVDSQRPVDANFDVFATVYCQHVTHRPGNASFIHDTVTRAVASRTNADVPVSDADVTGGTRSVNHDTDTTAPALPAASSLLSTSVWLPSVATPTLSIPPPTRDTAVSTTPSSTPRTVVDVASLAVTGSDTTDSELMLDTAPAVTLTDGGVVSTVTSTPSYGGGCVLPAASTPRHSMRCAPSASVRDTVGDDTRCHAPPSTRTNIDTDDSASLALTATTTTLRFTNDVRL